jgi:hypothetical protein
MLTPSTIYNIHKLVAYTLLKTAVSTVTENALHLHYKDQPVNAPQGSHFCLKTTRNTDMPLVEKKRDQL